MMARKRMMLVTGLMAALTFILATPCADGG